MELLMRLIVDPGIGRISKDLLVSLFDSVDILEQDAHFLELGVVTPLFLGLSEKVLSILLQNFFCKMEQIQILVRPVFFPILM